MNEINIGGRPVGDGHPCYIIAEIGINHNGDLDIARRLIDVAVDAGCDAVKFQKRTVDVCVPEDQKSIPRETPWGIMTYLEYRHRVEFGASEYRCIDEYCRSKRISWSASCWDEISVDFIACFDIPFYKIASASLTDDCLLRRTRSKGKPVILSTGMSTLQQIDHAVELLGRQNLALLHTCSAYPAYYEELNLRTIKTLSDRYGIPVGYSGHETGIPSSIAAVVLGACILERHITLDRSMWGSDQAASLEPNGIHRLIRDIRLVEQSMGDGVKRVTERERAAMAKLRRTG